MSEQEPIRGGLCGCGAPTHSSLTPCRVSAETPLTAEQLDDMTPQVCPAGVHPDWAVDSEDSHTCPWCQVADLSDQLAGARRTVGEQQDEIQQLRAARPSRAAGLRDAADVISGIDFHPRAVVRSLEIVDGLVFRLRRMADDVEAEAAHPTRAEVMVEVARDLAAAGHELAATEVAEWAAAERGEGRG